MFSESPLSLCFCQCTLDHRITELQKTQWGEVSRSPQSSFLLETWPTTSNEASQTELCTAKSCKLLNTEPLHLLGMPHPSFWASLHTNPTAFHGWGDVTSARALQGLIWLLLPICAAASVLLITLVLHLPLYHS